jgi:hypothetical protein
MICKEIARADFAIIVVPPENHDNKDVYEEVGCDETENGKSDGELLVIKALRPES